MHHRLIDANPHDFMSDYTPYVLTHSQTVRERERTVLNCVLWFDFKIVIDGATYWPQSF